MKPVEIEFLMRNRTKSGLTEVGTDLDAVQREAERTQAAITELWMEMMRLKSEMSRNPTMDQRENIAQIEALEAKIKELQTELVRLEMTYPELSEKIHRTELTPKDLPVARKSFNGLNMSIQQIAREMPVLAMGPQMFFMAISNNLPIFADEIRRAREEYNALIASGQKGTPVWKQVVKSLFSWQTAITAGIMLLVMYGKEIGDWVKGLFSSTDAIEENRKALERKLEVEKEANAEALKTRFEIQSTISELERFNGTRDEERRKIEALNAKYGETFGYYDSLSEWYDVLCSKAENYIRIMFMQAKAQSLIAAAVTADEKAREIETKGPEEYRPFWGPGGKLSMFFGGSRFNQYGSDPAELAHRQAIKEQHDLRDEALSGAEYYQKQMQRIREGDGIDQVVAGSVEELEKTIALKRKALKDITNKADYDAALRVIKTYEDKLAAITGDKQHPKDTSAEKSLSLEKLSDRERAARERIERQNVELMADGYDKERAQAELDFRREKQRIDEEERERLELYRKLRASGAQVDPAQEATIVAQAAAQRVQAAQIFDAAMADIDSRERRDAEANAQKQEKELNDLLTKYRDYEAQRAAIKAQGDADIAALEARRTEANSEQIDRAIAVARKQIEEGIRSVNDAEAAGIAKDNGFLKQLFGDYSSMSFDQLRDLLAQAKQLQSYLNGKGSAEGITFISPEELKNIEKSPAELDKLRKALEKLLGTGEGGTGSKWGDIFKKFEKGFAELSGAEGAKGIAGAIGTIGEAASDAAGELAALFDEMGDTQTADAIRGVQQVMTAVSNIGQGFAKGGIVGGIGAAVGSVASFLGQAFAAEARHRAALREIERAKLDFQRQYNLALLEQNLLMEQASNIFGERQIAKAAGAVDNYRKAVELFYRELAGSEAKGKAAEKLSGTWLDRMFGGKFSSAAAAYQAGLGKLYEAKIVTGHKKTGLFGWGKGKDVYSSILAVYPELIDANGKLDTAMLQTILDTRKMSKETRTYLEHLLDLQDAMEAAEQALEGYLTETFGSLGKGMLDALTTAIRGGDTALEGFAARAASVFETLGEQVAYSLFFADKFDDLQERLKAIYGSGKSEEAIAADAMALIGAFYEGIGSDMGAAQAWMEAWQQKAAEMGFDLWKPDGTGQSGRAGALTTLTQDQGTRLEGLMTSLQRHGASLDEKMDNVTAGLGGCLDTLQRIVQNTDTLPPMLALWQAIKRDGLKVK